MIGEQTDITRSVSQYFVGLRKTIKKGVKGFFIPKYNPIDYSSAEEMDDYIASKEYKSSKDYEGVCVGIEQIINEDQPNNYTFVLHYPDKAFDRSEKQYSKGVPDQEQEVWTPFASAPDFLSALRYQHNGFSVLQSVLANVILKE